MLGDDKHKMHFKDTTSWISRAWQDYTAFQQVRKTDKALAIYLLQQSIEKAIKALALASGRCKYDLEKLRLRPYGHDSQRLLLDFWCDLEEAIGEKQGYAPVLPSTTELSDAGPEEILVIIEFLNEIHDKSLSTLNNINEVRMEQGDTLEFSFNIVTDMVVPSLTYPSGDQSELQRRLRLSKSTYDVYLGMRDIYLRAEDKLATDRTKEYFISLFKGKWSLLTLFILASITFPHEARARYPDSEGLGCENYTDALGIVKYVDELGDICKMTLSYIDNVLELISKYFTTTKRKA